jgi:hypothetical protein
VNSLWAGVGSPWVARPFMRLSFTPLQSKDKRLKSRIVAYRDSVGLMESKRDGRAEGALANKSGRKFRGRPIPMCEVFIEPRS